MKKLLTILVIMFTFGGIVHADEQTDRQTAIIRSIQSKGYTYSNKGFFTAISTGDATLVEQYIDAGMSPKATFSKLPAIFFAIKSGNNDVVKVLLDKGANPNGVNLWTTPLIIAIDEKQAEIAQTLVSYGADVNQAVEGITPLNYAIKKKNPDIVRTLINAGATTTNEVLLNALKSKNDSIKSLVLTKYKLEE